MAQHIELNPVTHLTIGTVGEPGNRTFYLQGSQGSEVVSLVIEKIQARTLADSFEALLDELRKDAPAVDASLKSPAQVDLRLQPPTDALFRVGDLGLGYNEEVNRIVVIAHEFVGEGDTEPNAVSFWASPSQINALVEHGRSLVKAGRPICGNCGQPMNADHWCAQRNGHKH